MNLISDQLPISISIIIKFLDEMSSLIKIKKNAFIKRKRKVWIKKNTPYLVEKKESLAESDKGSFYNQEEWLEEYLSMNLYNTVETESEESETEYNQRDLRSD